jgi:hypothetical protein
MEWMPASAGMTGPWSGAVTPAKAGVHVLHMQLKDFDGALIGTIGLLTCGAFWGTMGASSGGLLRVRDSCLGAKFRPRGDVDASQHHGSADCSGPGDRLSQ